MKKKPTTRTVRNAGNGWRRIKYKTGKRLFFKKGKFTTEKKFNDARIRKLEKKKEKSPKRKWRKIEREVKKIKDKKSKTKRIKNDFCIKKTREEFYNQVLLDRKKYRDEMGEEASSAFQLWFQIGDGENRRKKSDKRLQYTHGLRKFVNIKKAHTFLGLDKWDYEKRTGIVLPKWKKTGKNSVCKFEKKAWLVVSQVQGTRALQPKILKKYIIQQ